MWTFVFSLSTRIMSISLSFSGTHSILHADFNPPIELEKDVSYEVGLLSFVAYNSIPNVDETNNMFHFDDDHFVELPPGTYEVQDIAKFIEEAVSKHSYSKKRYYVKITPNNNTMVTTLRSTVKVDFTRENTIGSLLGFKKEVIPPEQVTVSQSVIDVFKVNTIRVECSIASGSYLNGRALHIVHEFFPDTPAGYKIVERPSPVIYLPVVPTTIDSITIRVLDQTGKLINFRGETIDIRLHLRKVSG